MNKLNRFYQFAKWYYYLDETVCYKTNIIKIKPSISELLLSKNKKIINLLYKIIKEYKKNNYKIHYFLHLIDDKHYLKQINNQLNFTDFIYQKNNIELIKESINDNQNLYLIQQEYIDDNKCQMEKYDVTIWAKKIRSINLISSQNCKKRTIEIYKCIKNFIKEFLNKYAISILPYYNYNIILHCCFDYDYIIKCVIYDVCISSISGVSNSFLILPTERLIEYEGPNKYIKI